ncbi:MAG: hypothetical protein P1V51_11790 [Deltaproteobacteria bacterium]|nr:hypothetical protein [Deltaproteobacteria bacterium]
MASSASTRRSIASSFGSAARPGPVASDSARWPPSSTAESFLETRLLWADDAEGLRTLSHLVREMHWSSIAGYPDHLQIINQRKGDPDGIRLYHFLHETRDGAGCGPAAEEAGLAAIEARYARDSWSGLPVVTDWLERRRAAPRDRWGPISCLDDPVCE